MSLPSSNRWWLILVLVAVLGTWVAFGYDTAVIRWVKAHNTRAIKDFAGQVSHFGDWPFLMAAGAVLSAIFWKLKRPRAVQILCIMMISSTLAGATVNVVRLTVGRARPNSKMTPGWYGLRHEGKWIIGSNKFHSFPSGHTGCAIGFFGPLLLFVPQIGAPAMLIGLLIAASRICVGAHHLSDVFAATMIGTGASIYVTRRWPNGWPRWRKSAAPADAEKAVNHPALN